MTYRIQLTRRRGWRLQLARMRAFFPHYRLLRKRGVTRKDAAILAIRLARI